MVLNLAHLFVVYLQSKMNQDFFRLRFTKIYPFAKSIHFSYTMFITFSI